MGGEVAGFGMLANSSIVELDTGSGFRPNRVAA